MYPRNAASPEPIAIGAVVQISDGAVQTSGCTVRIKPIGVSEGNGGGTTAYSTDGIVLYTPTQAETNYTSFILIAKKTGCIPVSVTVVTTSSVTPGTVLLAPVTHTSAVVPTVTTLTNLPAITAGWLTATGIASDAITAAKVASDVGTEIAGSVWDHVDVGFVPDSYGEIVSGMRTSVTSILADTNELQTDWVNGGRLDLIIDAILVDTAEIGTAGAGLTSIPNSAGVTTLLVRVGETIALTPGGAVTVATNNDKTGYSLTATTGLGNQTADITGNLSGSVGSVTGAVGSVTGNVGGNVAGSVGSVTGAVGSVTGNVGGNVVGSVGSISGITFPSNFAALGINGSGHISRVTLVDTTTTNSDMRGTDNAALAATALSTAVWTSALATNLGTTNADLANGGRLDLLIDAIKAKTDSMTFTVAGFIDANIKYINDIEVIGEGVPESDPWRPV